MTDAYWLVSTHNGLRVRLVDKATVWMKRVPLVVPGGWPCEWAVKWPGGSGITGENIVVPASWRNYQRVWLVRLMDLLRTIAGGQDTTASLGFDSLAAAWLDDYGRDMDGIIGDLPGEIARGAGVSA